MKFLSLVFGSGDTCEKPLREWLSVPPFTRAFLKSLSSRGLSAIAELLVGIWCSRGFPDVQTHGLTRGRTHPKNRMPPGPTEGFRWRRYTCQWRCSCSSFCSNSFIDRWDSASRSLLATSSSCSRSISGERSSSATAAELTAAPQRHLCSPDWASSAVSACCCCCFHKTHVWCMGLYSTQQQLKETAFYHDALRGQRQG